MKGERIEGCDGIRWRLSGMEAAPKFVKESLEPIDPAPQAMLLEFPDLTSYLDHLEALPIRGWDRSWKTEPGDGSWCPYTYDETMGHARRGWDEGTLRVKDALSNLPPAPAFFSSPSFTESYFLE